MKHNLPVTSHHLHLLAQLAPLLPVADEPQDTYVLGSILSRCVCQQDRAEAIWAKPTFEEIEVSGFSSDPEPPRYSAAYLARVHQILFERDVKVYRLKQIELVQLPQDLHSPLDQKRANFFRPTQGLYASTGLRPGWRAVTLPPIARFYVRFDDEQIGRLYRSEFLTIRRLTRAKTKAKSHAK